MNLSDGHHKSGLYFIIWYLRNAKRFNKLLVVEYMNGSVKKKQTTTTNKSNFHQTIVNQFSSQAQLENCVILVVI